jgi:hypothetical protein
VPFGETGTGGEFQALDFTHKQVKRDFAASVAAVKSVFFPERSRRSAFDSFRLFY